MIKTNISNQDYHAGPGFSSSNVKSILKTPAHYQASQDPQWRTESDSMDFGTAFHTMILEPHLFEATCAIEPPEIEAAGGKVKQPGKKLWEEFKALHEGKTIFNAKDGKRLLAMQQNVLSNRLAMQIINNSEKEISAYHEEDGVLLKARADLIMPKRGMIFDLKTTTDASEKGFERAVTGYGYHVSAAHYLHVFSKAYKKEFTEFIWIAVENQAPFGVAFYAATEEQLAIGKGRMAMGLLEYKSCMESGEWPCYPMEIKGLNINTRWL